LKQRLVAAAEEHFAHGLLAPIFKPGKAVLDNAAGNLQIN